MVLSKTKRNLKKSRKQKKTRSLKRGGNGTPVYSGPVGAHGAVTDQAAWKKYLNERNAHNSKQRPTVHRSIPPSPPSQSSKP